MFSMLVTSITVSIYFMIIMKRACFPVFSSGALMIVTVMFLKLISYAHTNYWCRKVRYLQQAGSLCKQLSAECVCMYDFS